MIYEIVGLAGSGKSSLTRALLGRGNGNFELYKLSLRGLSFSYFRAFLQVLFEHFGFLLKNFFQKKSLRAFAKKNNKSAFKFVLTSLMMLYHFQRIKSQLQGSSNRLIDQGPFFMLANLQAYTPKTLQGVAATICKTFLEKNILEGFKIVILETDEQILFDRISKRSSSHVVKKLDAAERAEFFQTYQNAFENILNHLQKNNFIKINNNTLTVEESAEVVFSKLLK